jgi:hypothetical protein
MQSIAATEVKLSDGHKGTKNRATIAAEPDRTSVLKSTPLAQSFPAQSTPAMARALSGNSILNPPR